MTILSIIDGPAANIFGANPSASLVEFHSQNFQRVVYGRVARVLDLDYSYFLIPEEVRNPKCKYSL